MKVTLLAGGTGGTKLAHGFTLLDPPIELTVIANVGDDFELHGLHVSPDVDALLYTLGGLIDADRGWGIRGDTFATLEQLRRLGNDAWFNLGDKDLATHITRTQLLNEGLKLAEVTERIGRQLGVRSKLLPMSNERIETRVLTPQGELSFQEFFVKERWEREAISVRFVGAEQAHPAPAVLDAIHRAQGIIVCPSNPITSIGPILAVPGIRAALKQASAPVIGVSPIIGAAAISGPAHKLMVASGFEASALGIAGCYRDFLDTLLIDDEDCAAVPAFEAFTIRPICTDIRMGDFAAKRRLAREVLAWVKK